MILGQLSYLSESVVGLADVGAVILEAGPRNQVPKISLALKICQVIINNKKICKHLKDYGLNTQIKRAHIQTNTCSHTHTRCSEIIGHY